MKVYIDTESQSGTLIGYKGQSPVDAAMFFCPYIPGMSDEERWEVAEKVAFLNRPQTEIQKRIMRMVKNGN
jgi:hypothetical protein